jgi:hypothetical protein
MWKEESLSSRGFCPGCSIISPGVAPGRKSPGNDPSPNNGKALGVEEVVVGGPVVVASLLPGELFILLLLLLFCCCALGEDEEETGGVVVRVCLKGDRLRSPPPALPGDIIKLVIE